MDGLRGNTLESLSSPIFQQRLADATSRTFGSPWSLRLGDAHREDHKRRRDQQRARPRQSRPN
jgi:hypothetical protein